ncbi:MAG TPA: hypothetical protein VMS98_12465 [Thermoanaerobaculia bacterium]|nr:hypothetical protein [Thermoanaerobaculia bacterium]
MLSDDYFLEIEAHFAMKRGTPFILSAKDWTLMKKWREDGIPLPVVIEAIDSVFEKNETSGRRKVISSLSYCRHAVKEIWQERKELQAGDGQLTPEEQPSALLGALVAALGNASAPRDLLDGAAAEVRALRAEASVPAIEERLMDIEQRLIARILSSGAEAGIRAEAARAIAGAVFDEKTRARTEEANLRRIVREKYGLPRLTLFR